VASDWRSASLKVNGAILVDSLGRIYRVGENRTVFKVYNACI